MLFPGTTLRLSTQGGTSDKYRGGGGALKLSPAHFSDEAALGIVAGVMLAVSKQSQGAMARDLALWSARLSLKAESLREGPAPLAAPAPSDA